MKTFRIFCASLAALLASCSGSTPSSPVVPTPSQKHAATPVSFTIKVPARPTGNARSPHYISPATNSLVINDQGFNVTPTSPGCTQQTGGVVCTFSVDAPNIGEAQFDIETYDGAIGLGGQGTGNLLSSAVIYQYIQPGVVNTVLATLSGVGATAVLKGNFSPNIGTPQRIKVSLEVFDADGYAIVGPYSEGVQLDPPAGDESEFGFMVNGMPQPGTAWVNKSSDVITIDYPGRGIIPGNILVASGGVVLATVPFTPKPAFGPETALPAAPGTSVLYTHWQNGDTRIYFTEPAAKAIGVLAADGTLTSAATPSGGTPKRLSYDGQLDFVIESNNAIGIIDPRDSGFKFHDKALTTKDVGAYQMADDKVTESNLGAVGVFDNAATGKDLANHATGAANSAPAGITYGTMGYYIADPGANAIAHMDSNYAFQYFPVPTAGAKPTEIFRMGNTVWFTEPGTSHMGAFDINTHAFREYPSDGVPVAIATDLETEPLMVLTADGNIERYDLKTGSYTKYVPPASSAGPIVAATYGGNSDLILLRSNGTTGAILHFFYQ